MTTDDHAQAERAAAAEWQRQINATDEEQRRDALYVAVRAFQAALEIHGAEVTDYLALLALLELALDEYGETVEAELAPVH